MTLAIRSRNDTPPPPVMITSQSLVTLAEFKRDLGNDDFFPYYFNYKTKLLKCSARNKTVILINTSGINDNFLENEVKKP